MKNFNSSLVEGTVHEQNAGNGFFKFTIRMDEGADCTFIPCEAYGALCEELTKKNIEGKKVRVVGRLKNAAWGSYNLALIAENIDI
jgi:hypothetical protein